MATTVSGSSRSWLDRLWASIADRGTAYAQVPPSDADPLDRARLLTHAMLSQRGEASGAAIARELQAAARALSDPQLLEFYRFLSDGFGPDPDKLRGAAEAYLAAPDAHTASSLFDAAEPARQELLRRMNMSPGGTAALVAMRRDLLARGRHDPALRPLDTDLRHLFGSWFNRGFLELRRIDWQTPAATLEKLIAYEAVHEIAGWSDLRRRLAPDRRCFAFFHPALPGEPLIFVEVALTEGLAIAVQPLLVRDDETDRATLDETRRRLAGRADTAIFYSISNCQDGLRGVSFGNFLIKQVVEELKTELPQLRRFATLSPVPGFRRWMEQRLADAARPAPAPPAAEPADAAAPAAPSAAPALLRGDEVEALRPFGEPGADPLALWRGVLASAPWFDDPAQAEAARRPLLRLCAAYLTDGRDGRGPSDPVARFHLGNGAQLERIDWLGNIAPRGISESYGLMVNYLYAPDRIEANHEGFMLGKVARSSVVDALDEAPRPGNAKRQLIPSFGILRGE
ncbi:MAG: malonyl-CoA decarboxylase [Janthinobacterium lividum]